MWIKMKKGLLNLERATVISVGRSGDRWSVRARGETFGDMPLAFTPTEDKATQLLADIEKAMGDGKPIVEIPSEFVNPALLV